MKTYHVEWVIDVVANNPRAAAEMALAIQRDTSSIATVFEVREFAASKVAAVAKPVIIDLGEPE